MAHDKAYYEAEKKIQKALKWGATSNPSPVSPKREKPKAAQNIIRPNSCYNSTSPSPRGGKLEGGPYGA